MFSNLYISTLTICIKSHVTGRRLNGQRAGGGRGRAQRKLLIESGCVLCQRTILAGCWFERGARAIIFRGLEPHAPDWLCCGCMTLFIFTQSCSCTYVCVSKVVDVRVCCRCSGGRARCWPHNMHKLRAMQVSEQHISRPDSLPPRLIICSVCQSPLLLCTLDDSHSLVLIDTISAAQREELLPISACQFEKKVICWCFSRKVCICNFGWLVSFF